MIEKTYDEIFTFEALYRAHLRGRRCKRDKRQLVKFEMITLSHLGEIYEELKHEKFRFERYNSFIVYEPKRREIQTLRYRARIVQHVICDDLLMPYFSKRAILDNCVCQEGKGSHFALARFENMLKEHVAKHGPNGYFLKGDVLKYFPSIPHPNLKEVFCKEIADVRLKRFLAHIIDSYNTNNEFLKKYDIEPIGDNPKITNRGIPIGNQTSQVFGMFYLNGLDRHIKEQLRIKVYSRYMDDFVLVHQDKAYLKAVLKKIRQMMDELGLKLNDKTQIFPLKNGVTYLGFRYFVTPTGKIVKTIKNKTKRRLRSRTKLLKKAYIEGLIDDERIQCSLAAIHGHLKHGRCYKLEKEIFKKLCSIANIGT
ncbi:MAG: RNA-directed DNA polymerase, partial [Clostridia bacterium]|nr:RNA-directed DNA polymerase [Clostridia bacterium]